MDTVKCVIFLFLLNRYCRRWQ